MPERRTCRVIGVARRRCPMQNSAKGWRGRLAPGDDPVGKTLWPIGGQIDGYAMTAEKFEELYTPAPESG